MTKQEHDTCRWENNDSPRGYTDRRNELPPFGAECKSISGVGGFGGSPAEYIDS